MCASSHHRGERAGLQPKFGTGAFLRTVRKLTGFDAYSIFLCAWAASLFPSTFLSTIISTLSTPALCSYKLSIEGNMSSQMGKFQEGFKISIYLVKKQGMSDADFSKYYAETHASLAVPALVRHQCISYSQVSLASSPTSIWFTALMTDR